MGCLEKIPWLTVHYPQIQPFHTVCFLLVFSFFISGFNLYCWKGIHFSFSLDLVFLLIFFVQIICFHYWFRDLLRELLKKYEVLLIALFLAFFYLLFLKV